jgi:hypothetical protein
MREAIEMRARRSRSVVVAVAVALFGAACSTTPRVTLQATGGASPAGSFSPGLAEVPEGIVLGFQVNANTSAAVTAVIDDPTVATVASTTSFAQFVLIGLASGQTTVRVFVDNQEAADLPVQVTSPAP